MIDFSSIDPRLLFPDITEVWASSLELILTLLNLAVLIMMVVAEWKLFRKFGEKPWKSIVPYYSTYILYKNIWSKKTFWIYLISSTIFESAFYAIKYMSKSMPDSDLMAIIVLIAVPFAIVAAICSVIFLLRTAEAFNKGLAFCIGLLLIYPVFIAILGFGKAEYVLADKNGHAVKNAEETEFETEAV